MLYRLVRKVYPQLSTLTQDVRLCTLSLCLLALRTLPSSYFRFQTALSVLYDFVDDVIHGFCFLGIRDFFYHCRVIPYKANGRK